MRLKQIVPWAVFAVFVSIALATHQGEPLFRSEGPYGPGKLIAWLLFLMFLAYSVYCSRRENIFRTIRSIYPFHWARQIGIDLYLGLVCALFLIYLNEASLLVLLLWLLPVLLFANLATLLYFAMHYDSIVSLFVTQAA